MQTLALDVGSSSVKAVVLRDGNLQAPPVRATYPTVHQGQRVEIDPAQVLNAMIRAVRDIGPAARSVEAIALSVLSPAWVAMNARGEPLTNLITHQDRRSIDVAQELERRVGRQRHLQLAGNRPFPGGISSTTCAWFAQHQPDVLKKADLVGHLNTLIHRQLTGERVIDPSNASFSGLFSTVDLAGWSDELCAAAGVRTNQLPRVVDGCDIAGRVTASAADSWGLAEGTPVLAGLVDTSAAMLYAGPQPGRLMHMCGSTDVLGLASDHPVPHERLLTRALGVGRRWMSVSTLAAGGVSLDWLHEQLFADLKHGEFHDAVSRAAQRPSPAVQFDPYLAGERTSVAQRMAAFTHLTLATTREDLLGAVLHGLSQASVARLGILRETGTEFLDEVVVSGGGSALADMMHRHWPSRLQFRGVDEAGLRGLGTIQIGAAVA